MIVGLQLILTTSFLAAAILVYALGAGITAGAGTRLVLQSVLVRVFTPHPFHVDYPLDSLPDRSRHCLPSIRIGQFARLLPSIDVVAVSQAPSPGSNINPSLPVIALLVPYNSVGS